MNTQTNHGAEIPLPEPSAIGKQIVQAIRELRNQTTGKLWVVWAMDVEKAVIEEERQALRFQAQPETPDLVATKDRSVVFLTHRRLPRGIWYVTATEPTSLLESWKAEQPGG